MNQKETVAIHVISIALIAVSVVRMITVPVYTTTDSFDEVSKKQPLQNPFASVNIKAHASVVWDVNEKRLLFAVNERAQLPLASLAKIMTALLAVEEAGDDAVALVSKEAILKDGDHGFKVGERFRLKDLIDATLVASSNDGAYALASAAAATIDKDENRSTVSFVADMNTKARSLGLQQTFFVNESGFDVSAGVSGAYGSAYDVARLFEYALRFHPALFEATSRALLSVKSLDGVVHNLENTNAAVETFPGIISSKTGFTDLAGGNLAIAFDAGIAHPIIIVVLGSTAEERFTDAEKLIWATIKSLTL